MKGKSRASKWLFFATPFIACWLLFPTARDNLAAQAARWTTIAQMRAENRASLLRPDAGVRFAPVPVQAMLFLIGKHRIDHYRLSDSIRNDRLLDQRIVEGGYPTVPDQASPNVLLLESDHVAVGCRVVERAHAEDYAGNAVGAVLARCD